MKKMLKVGFWLIIFFLMISSFAYASFQINPMMMSEAASMILVGIGLISLGGFLRGAVTKHSILMSADEQSE